MQKPLLIALAILLILGGAFWYVAAAPTTTAFLRVDGDVEVHQGGGWTQAMDGMSLEEEDRVRTNEGSAVVVLYESVLVDLEPETEVALTELTAEHPRIDHERGSVWHKFTKVTGVDGYTVKTPTTVATVRGTEFRTSVKGVFVTEGDIGVEAAGDTFDLADGEKLEEVDGAFRKDPLTQEERRRAIDQAEENMAHLRDLRWRVIQQKPFLYGIVKRMYDLTDADVRQYLQEVDVGAYDLDEVVAKAPFEAGVVSKLRALTEEVIKERKLIESLR